MLETWFLGIPESDASAKASVHNYPVSFAGVLVTTGGFSLITPKAFWVKASCVNVSHEVKISFCPILIAFL